MYTVKYLSLSMPVRMSDKTLKDLSKKCVSNGITVQLLFECFMEDFYHSSSSNNYVHDEDRDRAALIDRWFECHLYGGDGYIDEYESEDHEEHDYREFYTGRDRMLWNETQRSQIVTLQVSSRVLNYVSFVCNWRCITIQELFEFFVGELCHGYFSTGGKEAIDILSQWFDELVKKIHDTYLPCVNSLFSATRKEL